jgi:hypothetical protein
MFRKVLLSLLTVVVVLYAAVCVALFAFQRSLIYFPQLNANHAGIIPMPLETSAGIMTVLTRPAPGPAKTHVPTQSPGSYPQALTSNIGMALKRKPPTEELNEMRFPGFALVFVLLLLAGTAHAQTADGFVYAPEPEFPPQKLHTPTTANPAFPLRVFLRLHRNRWISDYMTYTGAGQFAIAGATQRYDFSYDCRYSFPPAANQTFQARWADSAHHKLQILLDDPRAHKTHTCSLSITPS